MKKFLIFFLLSAVIFTAGFIFWNIFFSGGGNDKTKILETEKENLQNEKSGTIIFVGDIMLSRGIGYLIKKNNDVNFPFLKISDFLKSGDLTFGNLECPVSDRGTKVGSVYSFRADPKVLEGLKNAGFDVLSLANNHIFDYSKTAFLDTLTYLKNAGIDSVGAGLNFEEAHDGVLKKIGGANGVKIVFLAYTDLLPKNESAAENSAGISYLDENQMAKDIKIAKEKSDIVVIYFHFGDEYKTKHNLKQEKIANAAIDDGADLVVGSHPHVVQEVEQYKNKWIAYSLGNFVFDQNFSKDTKNGLALKVIIKDAKIQSVQKIDLSFTDAFQPMEAAK